MLTCLGQGSQTGPGAEIIFHPGHEAGTLPPDTRPRPPPAHHEPPTVPGNCSSMEIKVPGFQTFLIFQRDWGGGKVSDGSGGFWGHWSKSSASQTTQSPRPSQQQQGPGGPCSATCFRKETGRHRTSGGWRGGTRAGRMRGAARSQGGRCPAADRAKRGREQAQGTWTVGGQAHAWSALVPGAPNTVPRAPPFTQELTCMQLTLSLAQLDSDSTAPGHTAHEKQTAPPHVSDCPATPAVALLPPSAGR